MHPEWTRIPKPNEWIDPTIRGTAVRARRQPDLDLRVDDSRAADEGETGNG
jgi:hypothetical protein